MFTKNTTKQYLIKKCQDNKKCNIKNIKRIYTCSLLSKLLNVLPNHVERERADKSIIVNVYKYLIFKYLFDIM